MPSYLDAVQYVTSGLALVAFLAAVILGAYTARLRNKERMLTAVPSRDRLTATESVAREIGLDLGNLSPTQKFTLVTAQLKERARARLQYTFIALVVTAILGALAWVSIERMSLAPKPEAEQSEQELPTLPIGSTGYAYYETDEAGHPLTTGQQLNSDNQMVRIDKLPIGALLRAGDSIRIRSEPTTLSGRTLFIWKTGRCAEVMGKPTMVPGAPFGGWVLVRGSHCPSQSSSLPPSDNQADDAGAPTPVQSSGPSPKAEPIEQTLESLIALIESESDPAIKRLLKAKARAVVARDIPFGPLLYKKVHQTIRTTQRIAYLGYDSESNILSVDFDYLAEYSETGLGPWSLSSQLSAVVNIDLDWVDKLVTWDSSVSEFALDCNSTGKCISYDVITEQCGSSSCGSAITAYFPFLSNDDSELRSLKTNLIDIIYNIDGRPAK